MAKKKVTEKKGGSRKPRKDEVVAAVQRLLKAVRRHDLPRRSECIPIGFTILFDGVEDPNANCRIQKIECCRCEPGQNCDECDMKDGQGTRGKKVYSTMVELKIPDTNRLLNLAASRGKAASGRSPQKKRPVR